MSEETVHRNNIWRSGEMLEYLISFNFFPIIGSGLAAGIFGFGVNECWCSSLFSPDFFSLHTVKCSKTSAWLLATSLCSP